MSQNLSSAAVMIDALSVKGINVPICLNMVDMSLNEKTVLWTFTDNVRPKS